MVVGLLREAWRAYAADDPFEVAVAVLMVVLGLARLIHRRREREG